MISYWGVNHGEVVEKGLGDWARSKRQNHLKRKEFNNWSKAQDVYERYPIDLSKPDVRWDTPPPMTPRDRRKVKRYEARADKAWRSRWNSSKRSVLSQDQNRRGQ